MATAHRDTLLRAVPGQRARPSPQPSRGCLERLPTLVQGVLLLPALVQVLVGIGKAVPIGAERLAALGVQLLNHPHATPRGGRALAKALLRVARVLAAHVPHLVRRRALHTHPLGRGPEDVGRRRLRDPAESEQRWLGLLRCTALQGRAAAAARSDAEPTSIFSTSRLIVAAALSPFASAGTARQRCPAPAREALRRARPAGGSYACWRRGRVWHPT